MKKAINWLLNNRTYVFSLAIRKVIGTFRLRMSALLKGVKLGNGTVSYGTTFFYRHHTAKVTIGHNCVFRSSPLSNLIGVNRPCVVNAQKGSTIEIGHGCGFSGTIIGAFISISIGNEVKCGANTLITDSDWHPEDSRSNSNMPVRIEDNVWLGEGVKVLKGVTIGRNSVIGAGSVVTKDIPANVVAAGNPCRVLKELTER
jgi:acetyltransferase-like isoleucine patch superfamily enzyme